MRTATRTYYDVLGVTPETPGVVLKAAYRALAKEYHPDSGSETAVADPERFIELQDAYAVLSDPEARTSYDVALREVIEAETRAADQPAGEVAERPAWAEAIHASPALEAVHARFILYSGTLAAKFRDAVVSGRGEEELLAYAEAMEDHFLSEYFGDDPDVRALAKLLLLRCRKAAVVELNELLRANIALGAAEKRRLLAAFSARHFATEGLLSPWVGDKFAERPAKAVSETRRQPALANAAAKPWRLGGMVRVFCWSFAMYFGVYFVSSLID